MLTITTLTLTITGFSGPKIAAAGLFARTSMVLGILSVLASTLLILGGSLRIQWVTQFRGPDDHALVTSILHYRNRKTRPSSWKSACSSRVSRVTSPAW